jgi:HK97 family phage portal protein
MLHVATNRIVPVPAPRKAEDASTAMVTSAGGRKEPALYRGANRIKALDVSPEIKKDLEYLETKEGIAEHNEVATRIIREVGVRFSLVNYLQQKDNDPAAATQGGNPSKKTLPAPPTKEPILIIRSTVPPEGLFLEEAVDKNTWVNRCLNLKAQNLASVPLRVMRRVGGRNAQGEAEPDDQTDVARNILRIIERPNAHQSGTDLIEAISFWMNVRQALVWMAWGDDKPEQAKPAQAKQGPPSALYCVPAHRAIGMMQGGSLLYYRITASAGLAIPAWQIIRIGFYNPKEELRGLSPLSAGFQVADTDYATELWNQNFFEQGGKFSGLLAIKGEVSSEQRQRYKTMMEQWTGLGNAHGMFVIDADATFTPMASTVKDADFKNLSALTKDKLCSMFGVPRFMLGDPERSNKSSADVARRSFWQDTMVPEQGKIVDKLNVHLVPTFRDEDVFLEPDWSKVQALAEDRADFSTAFAAVCNGLQFLSQVNGGTTLDQDDIAKLLEDKFGIQVQGQTEDDPYVDDEEIMAESYLSIILLKRLKNATLRSFDLGASKEEAVPAEKVVRAALKCGMKEKQAEEFAEALGKNVRALGRDRNKVAKYFDVLIASARNRANKKVN